MQHAGWCRSSGGGDPLRESLESKKGRPWATSRGRAGKPYREIIYETCDGIAKIAINRPERRNAFTPLTVNELYDAFTEARDDAAHRRHHPHGREPWRTP